MTQNGLQELVEENMPWVQQLVSKAHEETGIAIEELLAAGRKGLIAALETYRKQGHNHQFAPDEQLEGGYAVWWVRVELMRLIDNGSRYS